MELTFHLNIEKKLAELDLKDKVLANIVQFYNIRKFNIPTIEIRNEKLCEIPNFTDFISKAFNWSETPEGTQFWSRSSW